MMTTAVAAPHRILPPRPRRLLAPFLALTFGLSWGLSVLLALFSEPIVAVFGDLTMSNPLIMVIVYAPGLAGLALVWRHHGLAGLGRFLRRLTLWRAPVGWWAFLLLGVPAVVYAGAAIKGTLGDPFAFSPWYRVFPALATALFLGPLEEFGWRGVALPALQRRMAPAWAGLLLGGAWGIWHLPSFMFGSTPQSAWEFGPFFAGLVAVSVVLTPLFNASRGSLLIAVLYHLQIMNPIWPDAQPWDNLLWVVVAVVVVVVRRQEMFRRGAGVTDLLAPTDLAA
jgi:membrane protease YdiL (CAAX protease family)